MPFLQNEFYRQGAAHFVVIRRGPVPPTSISQQLLVAPGVRRDGQEDLRGGRHVDRARSNVGGRAETGEEEEEERSVE